MTDTISPRLADYTFDFPDSSVADKPAEPRDSARLLVLDRSRTALEHRRFKDLPSLLQPGDVLVLNRSKVIPARLMARKETGGKAELLFTRRIDSRSWKALCPNLKPKTRLVLPGGLEAVADSKDEFGEWTVLVDADEAARLLETHGSAPLPPYILKRRQVPAADPEDFARYQTVYAKESGSVAAPTAGLHFTDSLLEELREKGVVIAEIVLHVGPGTFRPIVSEDIRGHRMLPERFEIPPTVLAALRRAREIGGRIVPVGTTSVRVLETAAAVSPDFTSCPLKGETALFITPGRKFLAADALVTNFHQPASTPLLLASAFAGRERLLAAYREAIAEGYRLFSYGDSMMIL